jgi:hypothetical protein
LRGLGLSPSRNSIRTPAAAPQLSRGCSLSSLPWILDSLGRHEKWRAEEVTEAANALAGLLDFVWQNDEARLRANASSFDAFRKVLAWHCDRQNPRALELLGRIGGFG